MIGETTDDDLLLVLNRPWRFSIAANEEGQELVPMLAPTAEIVEGGGGECCSVCKLGFAWEEGVLRTICSHIFHVRCIAPSLSRHRSCPVCSAVFPLPLDIRTLLH
ncbi:PREDICTED: E3 ubiquitin-protein ligase RNF126-like [Tarenaya hassleriana]|uniref:E3 ubiquitin-protein ligase RNF126-like n=1 Tax=Tarenaya hassleriana TaxID=28532 RepID=UPI00053C6348|nr:PREDICTED: E3 ubiquitin-protein ligase RNF126-like [Tarenaya hassleriana]